MDQIRTLKALADPLRLRMLAAVAEEELTVGEVQEVVASMQSAVSRNLAILREAGFVQDRKEGTSVFFSLRADMPAPADRVFQSLRGSLGDLPEAKQDKARLEACRKRKLERSRDYFESLAGDWEDLRKVCFEDRLTSVVIEKLLPRNLVLADIGCGTGSLSVELARFAQRVVAVDLSQEMLRRARARAAEKRLANIDFRSGNALKLPLDTGSVDAAFCVMVLHFITDPQAAVAELCRIVKPGGSVIVVDLVAHEQQWMREEMAHRWLGFSREAVTGWLRGAGADAVEYQGTGSFAAEKIARNGKRSVEIFVARAAIPLAQKKRKGSKTAR